MISRPSCFTDYPRHCKHALPIDNGGIGTWLYVSSSYRLERPTNPDCDETHVNVEYGLKQSIYSLSPQINGRIAARRCKGPDELRVYGDGYPWFELMYVRNSGSGFVYRVSPPYDGKYPGGPQYLAHFVGDWQERLRL